MCIRDRLYTDAMHTLYADASTPVDVMAWTALFDRLEKCLSLIHI